MTTAMTTKFLTHFNILQTVVQPTSAKIRDLNLPLSGLYLGFLQVPSFQDLLQNCPAIRPDERAAAN